VVFRYRDGEHYYLFSSHRAQRYRRLERVIPEPGIITDENGRPPRVTAPVHTVLAEDDFVYRQNQDYLVTVEAVGPYLRVYQDGALVFDVADSSIDRGRIGLYCWRNPGARFSDVRVDDFRREAPVAYRFRFTTSRFANFFHQMHSFPDETWSVELATDRPSNTDIARLVQAAGTGETLPTEAEAHAFEDLAELVLGPLARHNPPEIPVTT